MTEPTKEQQLVELREKIAKWLEDYSPKHNTTESGWAIIPEVARERYKRDAEQILALIKEVGYVGDGIR